MAYIERFIIGVILLINAYSLLEDAEHRHLFHVTLSNLFTCLQVKQCYLCIEGFRLAFSALAFTAAVSLVFDICVSAAVISEVFMLGLEVMKVKDCACICSVQGIMIHLLLLLILISNLKGRFCFSCCKS